VTFRYAAKLFRDVFVERVEIVRHWHSHLAEGALREERFPM
jgi:hypothetical protein